MLEHALAGLLRDTRAVVLEVEAVLERPHTDGHGLAAVLRAVSQKVLEELDQPIGIGHQPRNRFVLDGRARRKYPFPGRLEDGPDVGRLRLVDHLALSGHAEQVLDESLHAVGRRSMAVRCSTSPVSRNSSRRPSITDRGLRRS